jgi:hypothetical protein
MGFKQRVVEAGGLEMMITVVRQCNDDTIRQLHYQHCTFILYTLTGKISV